MAGTQRMNPDIKRHNRNRIFRYLCACGRVSNPDIAYALKISLPTVMQHTRELAGLGLVEEAGELASTGGRRAKALSVAANARLAVGLDITQNHVNLVLTNLTGEILREERMQKPFRREEAYLRELRELTEALPGESGLDPERVLGIGISVPGIVDTRAGMITDSHALSLRRVPLAKISESFPWPCAFFNDANAGAYAEGRAREEDRFFYLSLSNTVGGAFYDRQGLMEGKHFRCGEAGHMTIVPDGAPCYCGKRGCLDAYCSARQLADAAGGKLERFFAELSAGDPRKGELWDAYTSHLAVAVNNLHMLLDCDIVLGGYVGSCLEGHMGQIREKAAARNTFGEDSSYLRVCRFRTSAAAYGAALSVMEAFVEQV